VPKQKPAMEEKRTRKVTLKNTEFKISQITFLCLIYMCFKASTLILSAIDVHSLACKDGKNKEHQRKEMKSR